MGGGIMQAVGSATGNPVIAFSGEIDMATADGVRTQLQPAVRAGGPVVVDLSRVTFLDSSGIHAFIDAAHDLGLRGCIVLHGANGAVARVLEMVQMGTLVPNLHLIGCSVLAA
jgi:anti-sigma B factor antagonist